MMIGLCIILVVLVITAGGTIFLFKKKLKRIQTDVYDKKLKPTVVPVPAYKPPPPPPLFIDQNQINSYIVQTEEKEVTERELKRRRALYGQ